MVNLFERIINKCLIHYYRERNNADGYKRAKQAIINFIADEINKNINAIFSRTSEYLCTLVDLIKEKYSGSIIDINAVTVSRLLVETSSPIGWLIDEIGIAWDRILDSPYIPASSIKGAFRAAFSTYLISEMDVELNDRNIEDVFNPIIEYIFGSTKSRGHLIFFDAYPIGLSDGYKNMVELDVITPVYVESIEEHLASPTPVIFLVVSPGVIFRFLSLLDSSEEENKVMEIIDKYKNPSSIFDKRSLKDIIEAIFEKMLTEWGIGSKTSSGYGLFKVR